MLEPRMSQEDAFQAALVANEAAGLPPPSEFGLMIKDQLIAGRITDKEAIALLIEHHRERRIQAGMKSLVERTMEDPERAKRINKLVEDMNNE